MGIFVGKKKKGDMHRARLLSIYYNERNELLLRLQAFFVLFYISPLLKGE